MTILQRYNDGDRGCGKAAAICKGVVTKYVRMEFCSMEKIPPSLLICRIPMYKNIGGHK